MVCVWSRVGRRGCTWNPDGQSGLSPVIASCGNLVSITNSDLGTSHLHCKIIWGIDGELQVSLFLINNINLCSIPALWKM